MPYGRLSQASTLLSKWWKILTSISTSNSKVSTKEDRSAWYAKKINPFTMLKRMTLCKTLKTKILQSLFIRSRQAGQYKILSLSKWTNWCNNTLHLPSSRCSQLSRSLVELRTQMCSKIWQKLLKKNKFLAKCAIFAIIRTRKKTFTAYHVDMPFVNKTQRSICRLESTQARFSILAACKGAATRSSRRKMWKIVSTMIFS